MYTCPLSHRQAEPLLLSLLGFVLSTLGIGRQHYLPRKAGRLAGWQAGWPQESPYMIYQYSRPRGESLWIITAILLNGQESHSNALRFCELSTSLQLS